MIADFVNSMLIIILKVVFGVNVDLKIACHSVPTIFFLKKEYIKKTEKISFLPSPKIRKTYEMSENLHTDLGKTNSNSI